MKQGGAAVVAGQFGAWTPVGVEQAATGFEVAWKIPGTDQYTGATLSLGNVTVTDNAIANNGTVRVDHSLVILSPEAGKANFVFEPNFGQATTSDFKLGTQIVHLDQEVANMGVLSEAIHDDLYGNVVITDAARDTITIQNASAAQLLAYQHDLHFV